MANEVRVRVTLDTDEVLDDLGTSGVVDYFRDNGSIGELLEAIGKEACMEYFDLKEGGDE